MQAADLAAAKDYCFSSSSPARAAMAAAAARASRRAMVAMRARVVREGVPPREISVEHSSPSRSSGQVHAF